MDQITKSLEFMTTSYKHGIFGCLADPVVCLATACCPCAVVGLAVGKINKNGFDVVSCLCSGIGAYRLRRAYPLYFYFDDSVQGMFGIQENEEASVCVVSVCQMCSTCQDVSELINRGAMAPLLGGAKPNTVQPDAQPAMTVTNESTPALAKEAVSETHVEEA